MALIDRASAAGRPRRRDSGAWLAAGILVILGAQLMAPAAGPPLYDGVLVAEPYKWLSPPPGQPGGPQGTADVVAVKGAESPLIAAATPELVPQAQVFAAPGALAMPAGTTALRVRIAAVPPTAEASFGPIAGNTYRITIDTQDGVAVVPRPAAEVTVVLRHPNPAAAGATLAHLSGATWQPLPTQAAAVATFLAVVTAFGDFALIDQTPGSSVAVSSPASPSPGRSSIASGTSAPSEPTTTGGGTAAAAPLVAIVLGIALAVLLAVALARAWLARRARGDDASGRGPWG